MIQKQYKNIPLNLSIKTEIAMGLDKFEGLLKPWTKPSLLSQGHYQGLSLAQMPEGKRICHLMYVYVPISLTNCKTVVDIAEQHAHSIIYPDRYTED